MKKLIKPILFCFVLYYLLPIIGTILYASSTKWSKSLLPSDFTLQWFQQLLTDREFIAAVGRSLLLAGVVLVTILLLMIPTIIWIHLYFPRLNRWLEKLLLLPYALPGVILVTALLRTYAETGIPMFVVLVGALFITALPIVYLSLNNQMRLINLRCSRNLGRPDVYDYYPGAVSKHPYRCDPSFSDDFFFGFWGVHADEPVDWRSISDGTHLYAAADERKRPFG